MEGENRRWVVGIRAPGPRWFVYKSAPEFLANNLIRLKVGKNSHFLKMDTSVFDMPSNTLVVCFLDVPGLGMAGCGITPDGTLSIESDQSRERHQNHMADFEQDPEWREISNPFAELT